MLVFTDKPVRPTNLMGASKCMAEPALKALAAEAAPQISGSVGAPEDHLANRTCFTMVRFGNALDLGGSVMPLFRKQIAAGGGDVFLLDMGAPLKIMDMGRRMVELLGFKLRSPASPQGDTGFRPQACAQGDSCIWSY